MRERVVVGLRRRLGWAVTSPAAFAVAGAVDLAAYAFSTIIRRWAPGGGSSRRHSPPAR